MRLGHFKRMAGGTVIGLAAASLITVAGFAAGTSGTSSSNPGSTGPGSNGAAQPGTMPAGEKLAHGSDCFSCHAVNHKVVGPSFKQVANKFSGQPGAESTLEGAIKKGHVGTWGKIAMPPHPQLSDADTKKIVSWILAMKTTKVSGAAANTKKYTYTVKGKTVSTSFPIYKTGTKDVTPAIFTGYEQFNSYCFRCHGEDAVGGSYAPNLRRSVNNGMTESQFLSVVMEGRKAKGMPSWAGFFSPKKVNDIYQYVKARAIGVVGTGTPKQSS
jgi:cytochrome c